MSLESKDGPGPNGSAEGRMRLDLGVQARYLLGEWRMMARPSNLLPDFLAAIAVALVALPLSLAIANASGVAPEVGLVTAIVGGIAVALFGGCRLQVSGPAAAMTFLVYEIIAVWNRFGEEEGLGPNYGLTMIVAATLLAGIFQVLTGYFRIGRIMQFIPRPVVAGFLSGIGITILCTQLPKVLGYDVTHDEEGGAIGLLFETFRQIERTEWRSVLVGLTAAGLMVGLPKVSRKLPTPLIAVAAATLLPIAFGWGPERVALLGELPRSFPRPTIPSIPWEHWNELMLAALTIYVLASIESLLSASVVGAMSRDSKVDNDQELVGQGFGNVASAVFAGIPVTGVIARSATNIQSGARTRASAILHAGMILVMMLTLAETVGRIPIAALAGVLVAVATRMVEIRLLGTLWHGNRAEAAVYLVTVGAIVMTDLIVGVPVGLIAAVFYVIYEMSKIELQPMPVAGLGAGDGPGDPETSGRCPQVMLLRVGGPMFFASGFHLRSMVSRLDGYRCVILDLAEVSMIDFTAAEILEESIEDLQAQGTAVLFARPTPEVRRRLESFTQGELKHLRECEILPDLPEALRRAGERLRGEHLCDRCRGEGRCRVIEQSSRRMGRDTPGAGVPGPAPEAALSGREGVPDSD
ncbi:SulP family inorganic anion transporter [Tautonia plasticadhaerens]|uniref:C4-dicarboxylic acid transporter DauA n=1 Tax=Tautonia plasticadhaerens TaxID=2527974 RepID=A0A518HCK3_9BACT|nr:SulP family inorganic anion transporter [Tautonia plasticadhaerens]QDV38593.1 C4-dicarboxylic acid transporter DauA [Tautonia plasticadhaerens]